MVTLKELNRHGIAQYVISSEEDINILNTKYVQGCKQGSTAEMPTLNGIRVWELCKTDEKTGQWYEL